MPNHSLRKAMEQRRDEQPTLMMVIDPARLAVSEELGLCNYGDRIDCKKRKR